MGVGSVSKGCEDQQHEAQEELAVHYLRCELIISCSISCRISRVVQSKIYFECLRTVEHQTEESLSMNPTLIQSN